jgi:hypothetical protein
MAWWNRRSISIPEEDKRELEMVQREAAEQQREARSLLADAKILGEKCRESRRRNHYRLVLDQIFEGGRS